jgi:putative transcriptional regulator
MKGKNPKRRKTATARSLYAEIAEGFEALAAERLGKRTLRTHEIEILEAPDVTAAELLRLRGRLNVSRPVLAAYLRTNPRTLENWEQGRARPNAQAAVLIRLVERYPDTVRRLATL